MSLKSFSFSGLATRLRNVMEDLPHVYDFETGKIYTEGLNSADKADVRERARALPEGQRLTVAFTGAGKVFAGTDVEQLNRKRKTYGFGPV